MIKPAKVKFNNMYTLFGIGFHLQMDHMRNSGIEPLSVNRSQIKWFKRLKVIPQNQLKPKRMV